MVNWKKRIVNSFVKIYFSSTSKAGEERECIRIRSFHVFPEFDSAHPDEKETYIEAAEALQQKGVVIITWEKDGRGERIKTLRCENFKKLFREAGKPYPQIEVDKTKAMLNARAFALKESYIVNGEKNKQAKEVIALFEFLAQNFNYKDIGQGLDPQAMEDLAKLFEFLCEPAQKERVTTRALSALLYQDSKRLENLPAFYSSLLSRIQKALPVPDISFLSRSYPETMISGKIIFEYNEPEQPLINAKGLILNLPLETVEEFSFIKLTYEKQEKKVLTIENKETFYALGTPQRFGTSENLSQYDCFLYIGGYPNRAAGALLKLLASSGFSFHHAGDLDPDGILILQHVSDISEKPVTPVKMDAVSFNQYRPWARQLTPTMLRHAEKIREDTRAIPGINELLNRIDETGMGIEQEIIDYR
jgi:hypothetical protein